MKPKTTLHYQVLSYSRNLVDYNQNILSFAKEKCLINKGFATKSRVICMNCGNRFPAHQVKGTKATCPHCNKKLSITKTLKRKDKQHIFIGLAQVYADCQVIRYYEVYSYHHDGNPTRFFCDEILQQWFSEDSKNTLRGKYTIVSRQHNVNALVDSWSGEMEIRVERRNYYSSYYGEKYDCYADFWHPISVFKDKYKTYGVSKNLKALSFKKIVECVSKSPRYETLLKCGQFALLGYSYGSSTLLYDQYWSAIKICIRNKYMVKDASVWKDYIDLLIYFKKDTHNAFYVCPKNLQKVHDRLVKKKREVERKEKAERQRLRVANYEKDFSKIKSHLTGIQLKEGEVLIKTLDSVQEYLEEGDTLNHCVYTNEYFLKPDSLCLSARVNNEPVETIELDLIKLKVQQSRGKFNKVSPYHDEILSAVKKAIPLIAERLPKTRKRKLATL